MIHQLFFVKQFPFQESFYKKKNQIKQKKRKKLLIYSKKQLEIENKKKRDSKFC